MYVQACVCAENLAECQKSLSNFKRNRDLCCLFSASSSYFLLSECSAVRVGSHLTKAPGAACSEDDLIVFAIVTGQFGTENRCLWGV